MRCGWRLSLCVIHLQCLVSTPCFCCCWWWWCGLPGRPHVFRYAPLCVPLAVHIDHSRAHPHTAAVPLCTQVVAKHATELDYKRASHGEWVEPGSMPPRPPAAPATAAAVPAVVPPMGAQAVVPPGLMAAPGLAPGLIPGVMPGSAPLSVPAMHGALVHPPL